MNQQAKKTLCCTYYCCLGKWQEGKNIFTALNSLFGCVETVHYKLSNLCKREKRDGCFSPPPSLSLSFTHTHTHTHTHTSLSFSHTHTHTHAHTRTHTHTLVPLLYLRGSIIVDFPQSFPAQIRFCPFSHIPTRHPRMLETGK